jgi:hypothetical protein
VQASVILPAGYRFLRESNTKLVDTLGFLSQYLLRCCMTGHNNYTVLALERISIEPPLY